MQAVKPPGSPSSKAHRAPGSLLVHLHSGQGTPGHSGKLPPKGPGRVLPEKKFGGVNVGSRNSVLDVAGRVLPLSDFGPSADLELPRGPRATPSSQRGLEVRRARRPRKTRADPPPPSLEFAAKSDGGGASQQFRTGKALHLRASKATSGWELHSWARWAAVREAPERLHCIPLVHPLHLA